MTYYTCEATLEAMLSCIYDAWTSRKGHQNICLLLEPISQYAMFDEYIHVDADLNKVSKVMDAVNMKISPQFYSALVYTSMAYEEDTLDNIYRCMILGFAYGPQALNMVQYKDIMRNQSIRKRLGREVNHFQEFLRFHQVDGDVYVAHFEPKSRIVVALGPVFEDRMPSEHWVIIDDVHREAVIHPKDQHFYLQKLNDDEFERLLETEKINDEFTTLWKTFFDSVAIEERKNEKCQRNLYPIWTRKHAVELAPDSIKNKHFYRKHGENAYYGQD